MVGAGGRAAVEAPMALGLTWMRYHCMIAGVELLVAMVLKQMVGLVVVVDGLRDATMVTAEVIAIVATDLLTVTVELETVAVHLLHVTLNLETVWAAGRIARRAVVQD